MQFCMSGWRAAGICWGILNEHSHCSLSVGDLPSISSNQCVVFTMLVESHYVLDLCTLGWNWFLVKKHRNQNMTSNLNFSCTLMISSSSGVCLHAGTAGTGESSWWVGLVCITAVPLYRRAKDPWKPLLHAELCFPLGSVWILVSLSFLSARVALHTSAKPFTYLMEYYSKNTFAFNWPEIAILDKPQKDSGKSGKNPVPSWLNVTGRIIINLIAMLQFIDTLQWRLATKPAFIIRKQNSLIGSYWFV